MSDIVFVGNDNLIRLKELKDNATGNFINSATVTAQIRDLDGADVGSVIALAYVAASDGVYEGNLDDAVALSPNTSYVAEVTAVSGSLTARWSSPFIAKTRT